MVELEIQAREKRTSRSSGYCGKTCSKGMTIRFYRCHYALNTNSVSVCVKYGLVQQIKVGAKEFLIKLGVIKFQK